MLIKFPISFNKSVKNAKPFLKIDKPLYIFMMKKWRIYRRNLKIYIKNEKIIIYL